MRRLDFISKAPNFFIFKEGANKTNLGGFLYMVYIIIILLLAILYFFDYFTNVKYQFNYTLVKENQNEDLFKNENMKNMFNAELNHIVCLGKDYPYENTNLSDNENFIIYDMKTKSVIEQNKPFKYNVNKLELEVLYRCNGTDCTIRDEDKINFIFSLFWVSRFFCRSSRP